MRDKIIIDKMLRYTDKICAYCEGMSYEDFRANDMLVEACVFNLGQIGELTAKLGESFKQENAQVAWAQIYGLRNRIVHDYEGVNLRLIWEIIADDMPERRRSLIGIKKHFAKMDHDTGGCPHL